VKFIFATTEVHKVPVTILSRCQRYDFKLVGARPIAARLRDVLGQEKIVPLHCVRLRQAGELAAVGDEADSVHPGNVAVVLRHVPEPRPHLERPLGDVEPEHLQAT
jgi:hypothetical protein